VFIHETPTTHLRGPTRAFSKLAVDQSKFNLSPTLSKNKVYDCDHLVIVPGHAVMRLTEISNNPTEDSSWYLLDYQLNQGLPEIIESHISKGIEIASKEPKALLLFSGGQTRYDAGILTVLHLYIVKISKN
jgi:hypothetical protein